MKRTFAILFLFLSMTFVVAQTPKILADIKIAPAQQFTKTVLETLRATLGNPKLDMTLSLYMALLGAPNFEGVSATDCIRIRVVEFNKKTYTFADINASENSQLVAALRGFARIQKSGETIRAIFTEKEVSLPVIEKPSKSSAFFEMTADASYLKNLKMFPLPKTLQAISCDADKIYMKADFNNKKLLANILIYPKQNSKLQRQLKTVKVAQNLLPALPKANFIEIVSTIAFAENTEFFIPQHAKDLKLKTNWNFAIAGKIENNTLDTFGILSINATNQTEQNSVMLDNNKYYFANTKDFFAFTTIASQLAKIVNYKPTSNISENQKPQIVIKIKPYVFGGKISEASIVAEAINEKFAVKCDIPFEYLSIFFNIILQSDFAKQTGLGDLAK